MNLVEEKQRGLIPTCLQSWPLQLIEHLANTTSVAPPPAGPVGCRPLYLLHILNLSFTIWTLNRCCILQHRVTFDNIKLHLPIGLPKRKSVKIFLQNKTVLQRMNVPIQDTIVREQANRRLDRSKAVHLLWIFYVFILSCVCYVFVCVCLYVLCGHLLRKG